MLSSSLWHPSLPLSPSMWPAKERLPPDQKDMDGGWRSQCPNTEGAGTTRTGSKEQARSDMTGYVI